MTPVAVRKNSVMLKIVVGKFRVGSQGMRGSLMLHFVLGKFVRMHAGLDC
jgi:hypothetical protein